jgi:hypothetical protein
MTVPSTVDTEPVANPTGPETSARPGLVRARGALLLAPHAAVLMPWATLIAGCAMGTALLPLLAHTSHSPLDQTTVRLTFIPAVAGLAFVPHAPLRPLVQTTPLPAWIIPASQVFLAVPMLALTCWVQLLVMIHTHPSIDRHHLPALYPLIAQLTGWAILAVAVATCCDRSRYSDLAGAIAAPVVIAAMAFAWITPGIKDLLVTRPATPRNATIAWSAIGAACLTITAAAMRDTWHRYTRRRW